MKPRTRQLAALLLAAALAADAAAAGTCGSSLRFFGAGVAAPGLDRVEIPLDDPARPVDAGTGDFTVEWWMKAVLADNQATPACAAGEDNWITGNILLDRDVFGQGDYGDWGVSLRDGVIAFGLADAASGQGICGATNVADGVWHHVAVARRATDGRMRIWVDGAVDGEGFGPTADVTYRDGRPTAYPASDPLLVLGAEKHDAGSLYPSYSGHLDELRISTVLRYDGAFTPPAGPFAADAATAALYHFDEGAGDLVADASGAVGGPSDGARRFGGTPAGPLWSADTPIPEPACAAVEDLVLENDTLSGPGEHAACSSVTAGPNLGVVAPGAVTLVARDAIVLRDGFSVGVDAELAALLDCAAGAP
ncbi:MAG: LamG-like jellyroll fold domain-containing protein [Thermoanaerobaculia bacterium]|nr:LamG-like jellyroll fold domain-containing protein [Thermoanaerobaculia bacterium]